MRYATSELMKVLGTLLLLVIAGSTAIAQDDPLLEEEEEKIRRYTVELIVFSYAQDVSVGTEMFPPDEPVVDDTLLLGPEGPIESDLVAVADEPGIPEEASVEDGDELEDDDSGLVFLLEDEFTLSDIAERFERLDVYETIMHVGWTQPTYPEEKTQAIELWKFGDVPEGLDGRFTLYLSRYLHLVVDLNLDADRQVDATDASTLSNPGRSYFQEWRDPLLRPSEVWRRGKNHSCRRRTRRNRARGTAVNHWHRTISLR